MVKNFDDIDEVFDEDDFDTFKSLVANLNDINVTDEMGNTVLCQIVRSAIWGIEGKERYIKHLIDNGSEINIAANDYIPLSDAAQQDNCLDLVKLLVELGADVNFDSEETYAPIFCAINTDQVETASYLLSLPSFDVAKKAGDWTIAQFAKKKKASECLALFKEKGIK